MAVFLALPWLFDMVSAQFAADGNDAVHLFGWRAVGKQVDSNRVVWVPGDPNGDIGAVIAPRFPGVRESGRPLTNVLESFHCYITGYDRTAKDDERAQYTAARLLFDDVVRAIYLAAHGNFEGKASRWVTEKKEFRAGATILLTGTVRAVQPDTQVAKAPVDTGAILDIEVLDVTDVLKVPENHVPSTP